MDDLALFLHGDGIKPLLAFLGWVASGMLVAPVIPRLAREAGMPRGGAWTLAVVLLGPASLVWFLLARRRQLAFTAALRAEGIELETPALTVDPAVKRAASTKIGTGVALMIIGLALTLALSTDTTYVVFVGLIAGGAALTMRGFIQREGALVATNIETANTPGFSRSDEK